MKRDKRPALDDRDPGYPEASTEGLDRRRFFALLGAGAASALVFGTGGEAMAQRFAPPPPGDYRQPQPPPVVLGGPRPPQYRQLRLPYSGSRSANLKGDYYISYVLWVRHGDDEIDCFLAANASRVLTEVDRLLYRGMRYYDLDDPGAKWEMEKKIAGRLRRMLKDYLRPGLISVNLELVRSKIIEPLPGVIAPPPYR